MEIALCFIGIAAGFGIGLLAEILYEKLSVVCAERRKKKKSKKST